MIVSVSKSFIKGDIKAPSSKSYSIRALVCAALARGRSVIDNILISDDTNVAMFALSKIGVVFRKKGEYLIVEGGKLEAANDVLYCGESATTLRFMTAVSSIITGETRLTAAPGLAKRPIEPLMNALQRMGANCFLNGTTGTVVVASSTLKGGDVQIRGDISSQYISALLLVAPLAATSTVIKLSSPLQSIPYVNMTIECLKQFGINIVHEDDMSEYRIARQNYQPAHYNIEGDWSSASYLLAAGAIAGKVVVNNLKCDSKQGDRNILSILRDMGANITVHDNSVVVESDELRSISVDLADCIDLFPTVSVLAAAADGTSSLTGIKRARIKESNRVAAVVEGLKRLRVHVEEEEDRLFITGDRLKEATIDSFGDHRIAMAFAILGLTGERLNIQQAECVSKTYPEFWDVFKKLGGKVTSNG